MVKRPWAAALTLGIYKLPYPNCLNLAGTSSISKCWGLAEPLQGHYALVWPDYHILRPKSVLPSHLRLQQLRKHTASPSPSPGLCCQLLSYHGQLFFPNWATSAVQPTGSVHEVER